VGTALTASGFVWGSAGLADSLGAFSRTSAALGHHVDCGHPYPL
jgi:hypothetical protein